MAKVTAAVTTFDGVVEAYREARVSFRDAKGELDRLQRERAVLDKQIASMKATLKARAKTMIHCATAMRPVLDREVSSDLGALRKELSEAGLVADEQPPAKAPEVEVVT